MSLPVPKHPLETEIIPDFATVTELFCRYIPCHATQCKIYTEFIDIEKFYLLMKVRRFSSGVDL
jgi:hypothetical protein